FFFFQAEDGIRDRNVTGVQTCALPIFNLIGGNHRQRVHEVVAVQTYRRPLLAVNPVIPVHTQSVLTVGRVSGVVSTYLGANGRGVWVKGDVSTRANGGEFFNERGDLVGVQGGAHRGVDRKSTRLNSSHVSISYAVFCLKKKKERQL